MTARAWLVPTCAVAVWVLVTLGRLALPDTGLRGEYFDNPSWTLPPVRAHVDAELSTMQLSRGWGYLPPDVFTARWTGYLHVGRAGDYTFTVTADEAATLWIDRRVVLRSAQAGTGRKASGLAHLQAGAHPIEVEYAQAGGPYAFEWTWAVDGERQAPVPAWRLSPSAQSAAPLLALRSAAVTAWPFVTGACLLVLAHAAIRQRIWPSPPDRTGERTRGWRSTVLGWRAPASLLLFVVLASLHTWPLVSAPGRLSRNDNADTLLNEWTLAWVAHQLPRDPVHLFDAPIFHPEPHTLAYSEALVLQSAFAAPLLALGASPVLAYNLVLLAGMVLTGWVMCLVMVRWTGAWGAGLVAGIVLAFNPHTLTRLPHIQAQHAEFFPLALLAFDALLSAPRWTTALGLAATVVAQALASIYLLVFTAVGLAAAFLSRPEDWMQRRGVRVAAFAAAAALLAGVVLVPLLVPYWHLRGRGLVRSIDEAAFFAAVLRDYVTTPARWYPWAGGNVALFPGAVALALALAAVATRTAFRDPRPRMCLALAVAGVTLSFGPAVVPIYETLYVKLQVLQAIRTSSRLGYLGIVGVAVLAGYGLLALQRRVAGTAGTAWRGRALTAACVVLAALEPLAAPITYEPYAGINPIYARVAAREGAVVAEIPLPDEAHVYGNARYMLNGTAHWRPLVNGYSGFVPRSYLALADAVRDFPGEAALAALRSLGTTHVFVHLDALDPDARARLRANGALGEVAVEGGVALFTLDGH